MLANFCSQRLEEAKLNFLADLTDSVVIKLVKHCKRLDLDFLSVICTVLLKHSQYFYLLFYVTQMISNKFYGFAQVPSWP